MLRKVETEILKLRDELEAKGVDEVRKVSTFEACFGRGHGSNVHDLPQLRRQTSQG